jgi:hypothetical protein
MLQNRNVNTPGMGDDAGMSFVVGAGAKIADDHDKLAVVAARSGVEAGHPDQSAN